LVDEVFSGLTAVGALATAVAVYLGMRQVRATEREIVENNRRAQTSFEDDLSREYRGIVADLPVDAFYADARGRVLSDGDLRAFYRYFDLSNEQLFLASLGRVSEATAREWRDGIAGNVALPAFETAWRALATHLPANYFLHLRPLMTALPAPSAESH
jgi:hypothetical protein